MKILILNGPNLSRLDLREQKHYGDLDYPQLKKAIEEKAKSLMEFYQVPITELFPEASPQVADRSLSLNLHKLSKIETSTAQSLRKFTKSIGDRRKDWNGQLLTIRANDLQFLALLLGIDESATLDYLAEAELLNA